MIGFYMPENSCVINTSHRGFYKISTFILILKRYNIFNTLIKVI